MGMRLDYVDSLQQILCGGLMKDKPDIKGVIATLEELRFTRDDLFEAIGDVIFDGIEIPTKVKTAFTREYNKKNSCVKKTYTVKDKDNEDNEDLESTDTDIDEICDLDA